MIRRTSPPSARSSATREFWGAPPLIDTATIGLFVMRLLVLIQAETVRAEALLARLIPLPMSIQSSMASKPRARLIAPAASMEPLLTASGRFPVDSLIAPPPSVRWSTPRKLLVHTAAGFWPAGAGRAFPVVHPNVVARRRSVNARHVDPNVRRSGLVPALDLVGERGAVAVEEAQILTRVLSFGVLDVAGAERNQHREVVEILRPGCVVESDLLTTCPLSVPPVYREGSVLVHRVVVANTRRALTAVIVMPAVSVALEKAVLPPLTLVSAVPPLPPLLRSQARKVSAVAIVPL